MARFAVVTTFLRPRGWTHARGRGNGGPRCPALPRIAWPSWSPLWKWLKDWTETDATYFLLSAVIHMTVFVVLALLPMRVDARRRANHRPPEFAPPEIVTDDRPDLIHINF